VRVCRYADEARERLVETAALVIAESTARRVQAVLAGGILAMPSPSERTTEVVEEALTITKVEHDYRVVEAIEEANKVTFWKVQDGEGKTIDHFKSRSRR
jgi:hypothetical protein